MEHSMFSQANIKQLLLIIFEVFKLVKASPSDTNSHEEPSN